MGFLIAVIVLIGGICMALFALRPRSLQSLDVAIDTKASDGEFSLSKSLLLIGPELNFAPCSSQRKELRRILKPLLQANYKIVEVYGDAAPSENGQPYPFVDNEALRKMMNAEDGFHLIHVEEDGRIGFHSGQPVVAEALLHIFNLWSFIDDDTEEELIDTSDEEAPEVAAPASIDAPDLEAEKAPEAEVPASNHASPDHEAHASQQAHAPQPAYGPHWASSYQPFEDDDDDEEMFDAEAENTPWRENTHSQRDEPVPDEGHSLRTPQENSSQSLPQALTEPTSEAQTPQNAPSPAPASGQSAPPPEPEMSASAEKEVEETPAPQQEAATRPAPAAPINLTAEELVARPHPSSLAGPSPARLFGNGYYGYSMTNAVTNGYGAHPSTPMNGTPINGAPLNGAPLNEASPEEPAQNEATAPSPAQNSQEAATPQEATAPQQAPNHQEASSAQEAENRPSTQEDDFRKAPHSVSAAIKKRISGPPTLR